ncbi:MAG: M20 family metallopeptidase [bacterium]
MSIRIRAVAEQIQTETNRIREDIVGLRRHLHQHPELSWKEFQTAERIALMLQEEGLSVNREVCGTGLVADLEGVADGKTIAIRADMDALPIHDDKDVPYASRVAGAMHACGHDCHMSMAVGVAKVLKSLRGFPGRVRFIFQPSEEAVPSGACEMVKAGVMDGVDGVLAFHVDPEIPAGKIGLRSGVLTAHCSEFNLSLFGKGGHAARPHQAVDTVYLSARILSALYDIVGERSQPFVPAVLTVGKISGGTKSNIIPEVVEISGSIRTVDEQSYEEITARIEEKVRALTRSAGGRYKLHFPSPVPSVVNDSGVIHRVKEIVTAVWSQDRIVDIRNVSMGGEDFSWYLTKAPGALIRLGARKDSGEITYLHTNNFDIDERALPLGVTLMTMLVLEYLKGHKSFL